MARKKIYAETDERGHVWEIHPKEDCVFQDKDLLRAYRAGGRGCYVGDYFLVVRDWEIILYPERDTYLADIWEDGGIIVATITETA